MAALQTVIQGATGGAHPLDLRFIDDEDLTTPWKAPPPVAKLSGPLPASLTLTLADRLYVERSDLPQPLLNRLIRLAAFANPAFYKAQAMRLSVWNTAAGDRLRRELSPAHRPAARLPGSGADPAAGAGDRLGSGG